ncbi:MAG TPA: hypothetical protein VGR64_08090, partial [Terracidiphilus sp.]|nr:hypothetical protein [Terracidiphilus sp.]
MGLGIRKEIRGLKERFLNRKYTGRKASSGVSGWRAVSGVLLAALAATAPCAAAAMQAGPARPLPAVPTLMREVQEHQRQLDKVRESYTYTSTQTTQDLDANGHVTKTESVTGDDFFVNGHVIERTVKKNGQPLNAHDAEKEQERVAKLVEKAENTPPGQPLSGQTITVSRLLEIMTVENERRVEFRGRPTIVFDFVGRKNAKTHGVLEDASKKLKGTIWIDEADRQVARLEVTFIDNFHVAGGLLANVETGSNFGFDQAPVPREKDDDAKAGGAGGDELWLPTGAEGTMNARV